MSSSRVVKAEEKWQSSLFCELAAVNAGFAALSCSWRSLDSQTKAASTDVSNAMRLSRRTKARFFELAACNTLAFWCLGIAIAGHSSCLKTDIYEHFLAA